MNDKVRLVRTCAACPEQYEVFLGSTQIGYLRLRWGWFRGDYPDVGGETVLSVATKGQGSFTEDEREPLLTRAVWPLLLAHFREATATTQFPTVRDLFTVEEEIGG